MKHEDNMFAISQRMFAQVVDEKERYLKNTIINYAKEKYQGESNEFLFIDKDIADEIISFGINEYMKQKQKSPIKSMIDDTEHQEYFNLERKYTEKMIDKLREKLGISNFEARKELSKTAYYTLLEQDGDSVMYYSVDYWINKLF